MKSTKTCSKTKCLCANHSYSGASRSTPDNFFLGDDGAVCDGDDLYGMLYKMNQRDDKYKPIDTSLSNRVVRRARKEIDELCLTSKAKPAKLHLEELSVGPLLGTGGFSDVYEIAALKLSENLNGGFTKDECEMRAQLAESTKKSKQSPLALKHLKKKLLGKPRKFANGAIDLALEATFLAALDHPNILKIHGVSAGGSDAYENGRHDAFFVVLDRLAETLEDRVTTWRKQLKQLTGGPFGKFKDRKGKKRDALMADRLKVAFEIASGLDYLHSQGLIYRDLKPANVGFGLLDGKTKIFDFGLCREMPAIVLSHEQLFTMSGGIGTYRYMAPEVAEKKPYNQLADVYSFAMVLYEILVLNRPPVKEGSKIVDVSALRICPCWPQGVTDLLQQMLSNEICSRPSTREVCVRLKEEITMLRGGDDSGLEIESFGVGMVDPEFQAAGMMSILKMTENSSSVADIKDGDGTVATGLMSGVSGGAASVYGPTS